ncbi:unnamed protein product [Hymenolepis diminuta]|uniref:Uncharacterized protein n=1 Tax=Hymenolepis diminuta TaxID=6216 RepID=A0A564YTN7_HYMDI|nr:unnamed protein product [Hymenolepis diminuta]
MPILWRTSLSSRLPYRRRRCQNCNDNDQKEGFCREPSTNSSTRQNSTNKRPLIHTWQNCDTLMQFSDENETCQRSTLEPTKAENLVRGCYQCLHVAEIPHPSIHIQSPKPDSLRIQL